ncbi:MAG: RHS repeat domain-containing protein, partial [Bryobacteraceae bacterium]
GNVIAVTDEAGKKRQTTTDAAGRITQVVEDPAGLNLTTQYTYAASRCCVRSICSHVVASAISPGAGRIRRSTDSSIACAGIDLLGQPAGEAFEEGGRAA